MNINTNLLSRVKAQLLLLPDEAFESLQYLQPQVGCFNNCSFCSQEAGKDIWQFTPEGLLILFTALSEVVQERGLQIASKRGGHRPGVIFPYLDNDISTYPYLEEYFHYCKNLLKIKVRVSTLGFSNSEEQNRIHTNLSKYYHESFDGIRFSFTPYATGYRTNLKKYINDVSNSMRVYKQLIDKLGTGAATAATELRFAPLVYTSGEDIIDTTITDYHIIASGPHLLVSIKNRSVIETGYITELQNNIPILNTKPVKYSKITSDAIIGNEINMACLLISERELGKPFNEIELYLWENADGPYYAIDPFASHAGHRKNIQIYPKSIIRKKSGYIDGSRHLLNALVDYKMSLGLKRKENFLLATWQDVENVISIIRKYAKDIEEEDAKASNHITANTLPLIEAYIQSIRSAGFKAAMFFNPGWTIDTGAAVNQGRALKLFHGLAVTEDEPMSIQEERGYGRISQSSSRGTVWRIAPIPVFPQAIQTNVKGKKNEYSDCNKIIVEELDPRHLRPFVKETGEPLRRFVIDGVETSHEKRHTTLIMSNYPGA